MGNSVGYQVFMRSACHAVARHASCVPRISLCVGGVLSAWLGRSCVRLGPLCCRKSFLHQHVGHATSHLAWVG
eukprot:11025622-Alexandrium_andersonii.AAC.1